MRPSLLALCLTALSVPAAQAEGFALKDLTRVSAAATSLLGSGYVQKAEVKRLTLMCPSCKGGPIIDVLIGRQTDGTEQRVRSGETSIARLDQLCKAKNPDCRITALQVAPAVGWVSAYPMGANTGATAVIIRDGDLLTVRSLASDPGVARGNAEAIVKGLAPQIIGR